MTRSARRRHQFRDYLSPRVLTMLALGFSSGLPFNLVGGQRDPATDGGRAVEALAARLRRMGFSNLVSKVYADTRHESLNEVNRDAIMADFAAWAEAALKR